MRSSLLGTALLLTLVSGCSKPPAKVIVPETFRVRFETSQGDILVEAYRAWAPRGTDRFYELLRMHYFDQGRFFRVLPGFIAQFGIHRDFDVHGVWRKLLIPDDPFREKNLRGTLAFAKSDPGTRATEIFINLADNATLDEDHFVPFARVIQGMENADRIYSGYGELAPQGNGPPVGPAEEEANEYIVPRYPKLDYIKRTTILDTK
jgi:peptidyl-prolyl cis-trans isomerase A (cyclophilin A)